MMNTALQAFENLGDDEELGSADWPTVIRHISCLKDLEGRQVNPNNGYEAGSLDQTNIMDIRIRFLNGISQCVLNSSQCQSMSLQSSYRQCQSIVVPKVAIDLRLLPVSGVQAAYWEMLDDGRITQCTANVLMQSVDEALDLVSTNSLSDWRGLEPRVHLPNYYKFLQSKMIPRKLVTHLIVERLESACYISSAFLRAHRIARQQLQDFLGMHHSVQLYLYVYIRLDSA